MEFCIFEKVNNSIATKLCVTLVKNRRIFLKHFSAWHNSMTKLCCTLFKCENKLKIGWENWCTVLKRTQMRSRVEKVDVLGWNKSDKGWRLSDFGSTFLHPKVGKGTVPLNPRPKRPPYIFPHVVWISRCMKLSFFNIFLRVVCMLYDVL